MKYQVLDNGMPADTSVNGSCCNMSKGIGWDNCVFDTKLEAYQYADSYLGIHSPFANAIAIEQGMKNNIFSKPYSYNISDDMIQIKEIA